MNLEDLRALSELLDTALIDQGRPNTVIESEVRNLEKHQNEVFAQTPAALLTEAISQTAGYHIGMRVDHGMAPLLEARCQDLVDDPSIAWSWLPDLPFAKPNFRWAEDDDVNESLGTFDRWLAESQSGLRLISITTTGPYALSVLHPAATCADLIDRLASLDITATMQSGEVPSPATGWVPSPEVDPAQRSPEEQAAILAKMGTMARENALRMVKDYAPVEYYELAPLVEQALAARADQTVEPPKSAREANLRFGLSLVDVGVLEATIEDDDSRVVLVGTPTNEPLTVLLNGIIDLYRRRVHSGGWGEPERRVVQDLVLQRFGADVRIRVFEADKQHGRQPNASKRVLFESVQPLDYLARTIEETVTRLIETIGLDQYNAQWPGWDFPSDELEGLRLAISDGLDPARY